MHNNLAKFNLLLSLGFSFLLQAFNPAFSALLDRQIKQKQLVITSNPADHCDYNQRIKFIVLHYTVSDEKNSLRILKEGDVSAHYLIPKEVKSNGTDLWELVPIKYRAWHAGKSFWQTRTHINDTSVGIEIVNYGYGLKQASGKILWPYQVENKIKFLLKQEIQKDKGFYSLLNKKNLLSAFLEDMMRGLVPPRDDQIYKKYVSEKIIQKYTSLTNALREQYDPFFTIKINDLYELQQQNKLVWDDYTTHQHKTLVLLLKKLIKELEIKDKEGNVCYQIQPVDIIGHSDIAPNRKSDPGPRFPWKYLADQGIGAWPNAQDVNMILKKLTKDKKINIADMQNNLRSYGYNIQTTKLLDQQTKNAIRAFQWHFQPENTSGVPNLKTVAILKALLKKYPPKETIQSQKINLFNQIKAIFDAGVMDIKNQYLILNKHLSATKKEN